jgi:hypothetical protein
MAFMLTSRHHPEESSMPIADPEPDFQRAAAWWPDLKNIWTPIGWKDHQYRFNVLWNGTIIAEPALNRRTKSAEGLGVQLAFAPCQTGWMYPTDARLVALSRDDGSVCQGWEPGPAPRLWSEWRYDGLLLRQQVFAHVAGGKEVETGTDPLFAWIRLYVHETIPALPLEETDGFLIKINAPCFRPTMDPENYSFDAAHSAYPRELRPRASARDFRLIEETSRPVAHGIPIDPPVRLAIPAARDVDIEFRPRKEASNDCHLWIRFPAKVGTSVDILLPMLPTNAAAIDRELALGFDGALKESNRFWSRPHPRAGRIDVPETEINAIISRSLQFSEVLSERNPADGQYAFVNGSYTYSDLWTTPHAMNCIMLLDTMGHHEVVDKHLDIFRKEQGTITPPGDFFKPHPGYLSSPKTLTSIDWLSDHGALLYTIAEHAFMTGDKPFTDRWLPAIEKACDFIQYARRITGHGGFEGLMPAAVATDNQTKLQAIWNDGWMYKGLTSAARLLKRAGHPRAAEFTAEAADYRDCFQKAFRACTAKMPRWTDAAGKSHPFVPTSLFGETKWETRHPFYLDTGPLFMVFAGLIDADDPLMAATRRWFRNGPQVKSHRRDGNTGHVPILDHEMSSWEPCYSWNIFHSHALADRTRFLEGMYSIFAGAISRQTQISCESRNGITGTVFAAPLAIYLARLAVIDDQLQPDELHLLRLVPQAWLRSDRETLFEKIPTHFGPVTLRWQLSKDAKTLNMRYESHYRMHPRRVLLHTRPLETLKHFTLNGKPLKPKNKIFEI